MAIELYPHQLKAMGQMRNGCVLKGGVGTGKSRTAIAYYYMKVCQGDIKINGEGETRPLNRPMDLYIITTAKKRDKKEWEGECAPFSITNSSDLSISGVTLTVDSWNNIQNYIDVKNAFFIFDEQRLVGSGAWVKSFIKIAKANKWIVLSATPGDTWMDYVPIFIANGYYKNRTEFIRRHVVYSNFSKFPKIERYVEQGVLQRVRKQILVDMPYVRKTVRHIKKIAVGYDKEKFEKVFKDRWNIFEDRPIRDIAELFIAMRKVVNSDISRLGAVLGLAEKHRRLIIFYNFNYELDVLRGVGEMLDIPIAEWNGHKHQEIPAGDRWIYLVQYTAGAEGWNCTATDAMIFYSLNYSYKIFEQAQGRIDRLNTKYSDLYYYVLQSDSLIDKAILKALASKRSFNEKELVL